VRTGTERLLSLVLVAAAAACADSWVKAVDPAPAWAFHQRSVLWVVLSALVLLAAITLSRVPSDGVTLGAGVLAGGVLGNLVSAGTDHLAVPDPLFVTTHAGAFAFNLADTCIVGGNLILIVALSQLVIRHRDRLPRRAASGRR
jgi:lipoprotein signal peptidase